MQNMERKARKKKYPICISLWISIRMATDIRLVGERDDLSDSDIVREALQEWLNTHLAPKI